MVNISQLAMEERWEAGETLEGAGELLVVIVFHEVLVSESADDKN
jgi:hypothetical protein